MERYHIFRLGLAIIFYATFCIRPMFVYTQEIEDTNLKNGTTFDKAKNDDDYIYYQGVQGRPGIDFPTHSHIPRTSFSCRHLDSGYYADPDTACQVFHICEDTKKISFLCPNGTIFQQAELICEWWFKVNCTAAPSLYEESAEQLREDNARRKLSRRVSMRQMGAVMRTEEASSVSVVQNGRKLNRIEGGAAMEERNDDTVRITGNTQVLVRTQGGGRRRKVQNGGSGGNLKISLSSGAPTRTIRLQEENVNNQRQRNVAEGVKRDLNQEEGLVGGTDRNKAQQAVTSQNEGQGTRSNSVSQQLNDNQQRNGGTVRNQNQNDFGLSIKNLNEEESSVGVVQNQNANRQIRYKSGSDQKSGSGANLKISLSSGVPNRNIRLDNANVGNQLQGNEGDGVKRDLNQDEIIVGGTTNQNQAQQTVKSQSGGEFTKTRNSNSINQQINTEQRGTIRNQNQNGLSKNKQNQNVNNEDERFAGIVQNQNAYREVRYKSGTDQKSGSGVKQNLRNEEISFAGIVQNQNANHQIRYKSGTDGSYNQKVKQEGTSQRPYQNNQDAKSSPQHKKIVSGSNQYLPKQTADGASRNQYQQSNKIGGQNKGVLNQYQNSATNSNNLNVPLKQNQVGGTIEKESGTQQPLYKSTTKLQQYSTNRFEPIIVEDTTNPPIKQSSRYQTGSTFESEAGTTPLQQYQTFKTYQTTFKPILSTSLNKVETNSKYLEQDFGTTVQSQYQSTKTPRSTTTKPKLFSQKVTLQPGTTPFKNYAKQTQKSTVPHTRNDLTNHRLVDDDSESQITQETAGFYSSSKNRLQSGNHKTYASSTTHPNHHQTYQEVKAPQYYSTKIISTLSSVTPHYLTTQPLNNGRPFVGSRVGTTYYTSTTPSTTTELFNVGKTGRPLPVQKVPFTTTTTSTFKASNPTVPPIGSLNIGEINLNPTLPPFEDSTTKQTVDHATVYGRFVTSTTPSLELLKTSGSVNTAKPFNQISNDYKFSTVGNSVQKPRPFQLANPLPTYQVSTAGPFKVTAELVTEVPTMEPTSPTVLTTSTTLNSSSLDSMISALAEMAHRDYTGASPRPGLIVPPSAGPQTLHSLAVYFANALDGVVSNKTREEGAGGEEKRRLTALLTEMTMQRYNQLFEPQSETTADDLEPQHSGAAPVEGAKVRQLAKVFTQALSSYLDDPVTFRRVLEEVRPTEPPPAQGEELDELLNFSDADSKSSYPPIYPTLPSVRPTWGYILAGGGVEEGANNLGENLQVADSQSFVGGFNRVDSSTRRAQLPEGHWTSSPGVGKLWRSTFGFDPAAINDNFEVTTAEGVETTTGWGEEYEAGAEGGRVEGAQVRSEVRYEVRALPELALNETQVQGILIDFMNATHADEKLHRILRKLNTTEEEFVERMREIDANPLTRRLILLLISECGRNATGEAVPVRALLGDGGKGVEKREEKGVANGGAFKELVDEGLDDEKEDTRALQLLNSLYTIASRFGK